MRIFFIVLLILSLYNLSSANQKIDDYNVPILFEPNHGQFEFGVRLAARTSRLNFLLTQEGAKIRFPNSTAEIEMTAEGSTQSDPIGMLPAKAKIHYFKGDQSITGVPGFGAAIYKDIYSGVNWVFYEKEGFVEFDFLIAPHSDINQIGLAMNGADRILIEPNGDLIVSAQSNELRLHAPVAFQCDAYELGSCTNKQEVSADYEITQDNKISFHVGSYDPDKTLVIDPKIGYGTLLGGNTYDTAADVAVDSKGNFYVVGYTEANTRIPGNGDGFVHKFSPAGALIWTTFLVGSSGEGAGSIAVNPAGICFVGGSTSSRDFPIAGAFQPNFGGSLDGFIVKLAANGTIMRSSFIGGSGRDVVTGVQLGKGSKMTNGLYLFGNTDSRNFPRNKATQSQFGGGSQDGFLTIVHSIQFQQVFSSYVGRNGTDQITSVALNTQRGDLYVMALSDSAEGSYITHLKPKIGNGVKKNQPEDLITLYTVAEHLLLSNWFRQDPSFIKFAFVSIFGGTPIPTVKLNKDSAAPRIVLATVCPRPEPNTPCFDNGSLTFFDQDLNRQSSMNFGGTGPGLFFINDFVVGRNGAFYFVGDTLLKNLPLVNPVQSQHKGGYEAYILSLAPSTFQPTFYSYLGGPLSDFASGVAVDNAGNIFVVGQTSSKNFPTTPGAPKRTVTGTADGYVVKITP